MRYMMFMDIRVRTAVSMLYTLVSGMIFKGCI